MHRDAPLRPAEPATSLLLTRLTKRKDLVCFSPEGDLVGGLVVTAIGIDACRHVGGRSDHRLLAAFPCSSEPTSSPRRSSGGASRVSCRSQWAGWPCGSTSSWRSWCYPSSSPGDHLFLEPTAAGSGGSPRSGRRAVVSGVLLEAILRRHPTVHLGAYHLSYTIGLQHGSPSSASTSWPRAGLSGSGFRDFVIFGVANVVAVVILARSARTGSPRCGASMPPWPAGPRLAHAVRKAAPAVPGGGRPDALKASPDRPAALVALAVPTDAKGCPPQPLRACARSRSRLSGSSCGLTQRRP